MSTRCNPLDFKDIDFRRLDKFSRLIYLSSLNESDYKELEGKHNGEVGIPYLDIGIKGDWHAKQQTVRQLQRMMGFDLTEESRETVLHNGWHASGLEAYKACLLEHEDLTLTASPSSVELPEFVITLFWKPRPGGVGKISSPVIVGGRVLNKIPSTIATNHEVHIKVARDRDKPFQLALTVNGVAGKFELPRQPRKLEVKTRNFDTIRVTQGTHDFNEVPTAGFEFVPQSLIATGEPEPWGPYGTEPGPKVTVTTVVNNENKLNLTLYAYRSQNIATTGIFGVSIKEIRSVDA